MKSTIPYGPGDVRFDERPDPIDPEAGRRDHAQAPLLRVPRAQVADGYRAIDERRAIETLFMPNGTVTA